MVFLANQHAVKRNFPENSSQAGNESGHMARTRELTHRRMVGQPGSNSAVQGSIVATQQAEATDDLRVTSTWLSAHETLPDSQLDSAALRCEALGPRSAFSKPKEAYQKSGPRSDGR